MSLLIPLLGVLEGVSLLLSSATRGRWAARDRLQVLRGGVGAVTVLLIVQRLADWSTGPMIALWFLAVVLVALGAAAAAVRWRALPWRREERRVRGPLLLAGNVLLLAGSAALLL